MDDDYTENDSIEDDIENDYEIEETADGVDDYLDEPIYLTYYYAKKWSESATTETRYTPAGQAFYQVDEYGNPQNPEFENDEQDENSEDEQSSF